MDDIDSDRAASDELVITLTKRGVGLFTAWAVSGRCESTGVKN
jgi:hypothetical protein